MICNRRYLKFFNQFYHNHNIIFFVNMYHQFVFFFKISRKSSNCGSISSINFFFFAKSVIVFLAFKRLSRRMAIAPILVEGRVPFHFIVLLGLYPKAVLIPISEIKALVIFDEKFLIKTALPPIIFPLPGNTTEYKIPDSIDS